VERKGRVREGKGEGRGEEEREGPVKSVKPRARKVASLPLIYSVYMRMGRRWRVGTGELASAEVLGSIDKLTVANVVIEVFILVVIVVQTFFIG